MPRHRITIADLNKIITTRNETIRSMASAEVALREEGQQTIRQRDKLQAVANALEDELAVVQSDRDRLTATVESLSRRLASPYAESDIRRAGWRAMGRMSPENLKGVEPRDRH